MKDSEVVITHQFTRKRSKIISAETAAILKGFATPQTWAESIIQHAIQTHQDPQQLAEKIFPLIWELTNEGYLVKEKEQKNRQQKILQPGTSFRNFTIKQACQVLDDSAVYRVEDEKANSFALKLFYPVEGDSGFTNYEREAAILKKLDGVVNPRLFEKGRLDTTFFLVTEWCEGKTCEEAAARYRNFSLKENARQLLRLCLAIAGAFQHLHRQGILHGDIHPNNILVSDDFTVKILDFGNAFDRETKPPVLRGGTEFYYEPELVKALLLNETSVPVTFKSEQYAVAALLYRLLTGYHYLRFSYEPTIAYRQILNEKPISLETFDLGLPAMFDDIFQKALAKEPQQRYDSLDLFIKDLENGKAAVEESPAFFTITETDKEKKFIQFQIHKYGWKSPLLKNGLGFPPVCSAHSGAAGIAYFLYRAACVYAKPDLLDLADVWANRAGDYHENYERAFYSGDDLHSEKTAGRISLYHSPAGVHVVQSLVSNCRVDRLSLWESLNKYLQAMAEPNQTMDLTQGKAGLLLAGALLLKELDPADSMEKTTLLSNTKKVMQELWQQLEGLPAMNKQNEIDYFGMAHGWAGILYATLLWCQVAGQLLPIKCLERLEELQNLATWEKGTLRWPVSLQQREAWLGWCHGNAGYTFLWCQAYQFFKEEHFLGLAEKAAMALFDTSHQTMDLCCGLSGQAYALLKMYRTTGHPVYFTKVEQLKNRIIQQVGSPDLRRNSLYKGEVGIGLLLCELTRPELARMPLFE